MLKLDNVRLLVTNFDECFLFYRDILEFRVSWGELGGGYASFEAEDGGSFAIFSKDEMAETLGTEHLPSNVEAQDRFALIFRTDDMEAVVGRLRAKGVSLVAEVNDRPEWGIRTAHLRDPEGNLIEIVTPLPKEQWSQGLLEEDRKYE
ncbi:VOC family protein [Cytobacillus sp. FJAT-54145]|uniref:VOC family protein n=1 Tax=Cytobacillus spartinae TaxID=3299023 RepID=A0ABW6K8V9_9BACI